MLMKENKKKFEKKILGDNLINYSIIIGYKEYKDNMRLNLEL